MWRLVVVGGLVCLIGLFGLACQSPDREPVKPCHGMGYQGVFPEYDERLYDPQVRGTVYRGRIYSENRFPVRISAENVPPPGGFTPDYTIDRAELERRNKYRYKYK